MREIIFRGKRKDNGEWVEGSLILTTSTTEKPFIVDSCWCYSGSVDDEGYAKFEYLNAYEVVPETVGQYTGITDKNGKKIFEDDILRIGYCFGWDSEQEKKVPEEEYISKVYSIDACPFCVDLQHCDGDMSPVAWLDWSYDDTEIDVIGNIHDNPELLKGGG